METDLLQNGRFLPIMEEFYSLQGEGYNTGKPAYFIRIGGCDVGCRWCDVKESWNRDLHPAKNVDDVVENATQQPAKAVVITGGEPLLYNLDYLCTKLKDNNISTYLETSGSAELSGKWDWICLSPKKNAPPIAKILDNANELKMIICSPDDFLWAEENSELVNKDCLLYLQPEWSTSKVMIQKIVDYILINPKWRISLQAHKYMRIP
jgi:organic radical activating enzyme